MRLIVGLGNPGEEYSDNRHNVGFMVVDKVAQKLKIKEFIFGDNAKALYARTNLKGQEIELIKPQTFMNNSGNSISYAYIKHSLCLDDLFVVHDDLDLTLGYFKIQKGKGPKDHKGLLSIYVELGTQDFWHVRVGVDNRGHDNRIPGEKYVLQDFTQEELEILGKAIDKITSELTNQLTE